jgi:hypothetical protein
MVSESLGTWADQPHQLLSAAKINKDKVCVHSLHELMDVCSYTRRQLTVRTSSRSR